MYESQQFSAGVHSSLLVAWTMRCETPLAIRNGEKLAYSSDTTSKTRGRNLRLRWEKGADVTHEVAALHYGYVVEGNQVAAYHFVPPSTIRGALRSWTVQQFVHPLFRSGLTPPAQNDPQQAENYIANLRLALQQRTNGYELIASLFGLATDTRSESQSDSQIPSNAGRLLVETDRFERVNMRGVDASGVSMAVEVGPGNVKRHMTVRNPLDRMTHASRDGGLHQFLEFSRGEEFRVRLSILNPQASDLALVGIWAREIGYGLLRFGALSSIGRGRLAITSQKYDLWRRPNAPSLQDVTRFAVQTEDEDDALADFWHHFSLPPDALTTFESALLPHSGEATHA